MRPALLPHARRVFTLTLIAASLAACGGGGGGGGSPSSPQTGGGTGPGGTTPTVSPLSLELVSAQGQSGNRIAMGEPGTVRLKLLDGSGKPVANQLATVRLDDASVATLNDPAGATTFAADGQAGSTIKVVTDANGIAETPIYPLARGATTLLVTVGSQSKALVFAVDPQRIQLSNLQPGIATLLSGSSTAVTVDATDLQGKAVTAPVAVTFWSDCSKQGKATFNGASEVTLNTSLQTVNGAQFARARADYKDKTCGSSDALYAKALTTQISTPLTIQPVSQIPASLSFVSATPSRIKLKGMSGPTTSDVAFQLSDSNNNPQAGIAVNFALNTRVGGLDLSQATGLTDAQGRVTVKVLAGTIGTPVRVTATATHGGKAVSVQSEELFVSTGLPHQNGFSLSVSTANPEFLDIDNQKVTLSVGASDRAGNPVPDNTAIAFKTEAGIGRIDGGCITKDGTCTVNFYSSGNRKKLVPDSGLAGRQTIVAYMIGEESFTDSNGNGSFDRNVPGVPDETFGDLKQAYIDMNQNGAFDRVLTTVDGAATGEEPFAFDANTTTSAGDSCFNGALNNDSRCTNTNASTTVRDSVVVIWSGSTWDPALPNTLLNRPQLCVGRPANADSTTGGDTGTLTIRPQDVNGNPMPAGSTVTFRPSKNTSLNASSFTIPSQLYASAYSVDVSADSCKLLGDENITVEVKTPSGVITTFKYPVR